MISQEAFANAFRQMSSLDWSTITELITKYDATAQKASVRILNKKILRDKSTTEYPKINGVPVMMPRTAYAGIQLPVQVGDKVLLIFTQKSIEKLLYTDLSGTSIPETVDPKSTRLKDFNDCVALVGFSDYIGAHGTSDSLKISNNISKGTNNYIEFKANGNVVIDSPNTVSVNASQADVNADTINLNAPETICSGSITAESFIHAPTGGTVEDHYHNGDSGGTTSGPIYS